MKPLLILAYHFPPENATGAARPFRFYRYLPEFGYQPYVVAAGDPNQASPLKNVCYVPDKFISAKKTFSEKVLRKFLFPTDEGVFWTRSATAVAEKIVATHSVPAVVSTAPPFTTHMVALALKRRRGLKWIADFRDPLVGNPFRIQSGFPALVDRYLQARFLSYADALISVTDVFGRDWYRADPSYSGKVHTIWNGFDPDEVFPSPKISPQSRQILSHVGGLYGGRDGVQILQSLERLIGRGKVDPNHLLVRLIGYLEPRIEQENQALFRALKEKGCLEYGGEVPRNQALQILADSNYLLLLDGNRQNLAYAVPAKFYEYVRIGRPILTNTQRNSPLDHFVPECGIRHIIIYTDDSVQETDRKMMDLLALSSEPVSPSPWFSETFDGRRHAGALAAILDNILRSAPDIIPVAQRA